MDILTLDKNLFILINHGLSNKILDILMPAITSKGYLLLLPYAAYMLIAANKKKAESKNSYMKAALWTIAIAIVSFSFADWTGNNIKHIIGRVRPCNALDGALLLVGCTKSSSMPSNHAVNFFACAVPLFFLTREYLKLSWRIFPLVLASLVAFSRVYVGVHYPTDVAVGAMLGTTIASLAICIYKHCLAEKDA